MRDVYRAQICDTQAEFTRGRSISGLKYGVAFMSKINISLAGRDPQWVHERLVFERFIDAAGLRVQPESIKRGPQFDIVCETIDGQPLLFELTEAVDKGWASNIGAMTETTRLLLAQLRGGDDHDSRETRSRYHGWDICVTLPPAVG